MIAGDPVLQNARATVLYKADWHQGVLGIVASRCLDQYYRPTVILTQRDGKATGSARSVAGFDVHDCPGGLLGPARPVWRAPRRRRPHPEGGKRARLPAPASSKWWPDTLTTEHLVRPVEIAAVLPIAPHHRGLLCRAAPHGALRPRQPQPGVQPRSGSWPCPTAPAWWAQGHLKLRLAATDAQGPAVDAIGFGLADYLPQIEQGQPFSACYTIEMNEYRGQRSVQLRLLDIRWE